jgi:hypothetical protein
MGLRGSRDYRFPVSTFSAIRQRQLQPLQNLPKYRMVDNSPARMKIFDTEQTCIDTAEYSADSSTRGQSRCESKQIQVGIPSNRLFELLTRCEFILSADITSQSESLPGTISKGDRRPCDIVLAIYPRHLCSMYCFSDKVRNGIDQSRLHTVDLAVNAAKFHTN